MRSLHMAAASFMTKYGHEGLSGILLWFSSYWAQTFLHTALIPCDCEAPACWRSNFVETPQMRMKQKWSSRFDHRCKDRRESIPFVRNPVLCFDRGGWCNKETSCMNSKRPKNILHNITFWLNLKKQPVMLFLLKGVLNISSEFDWLYLLRVLWGKFCYNRPTNDLLKQIIHSCQLQQGY